MRAKRHVQNTPQMHSNSIEWSDEIEVVVETKNQGNRKKKRQKSSIEESEKLGRQPLVLEALLNGLLQSPSDGFSEIDRSSIEIGF